MKETKVKKYHWTTILSIVLALAWFALSIYCYFDVSAGVDSENFEESLGTALGMVMIWPYIIASGIGTLLHTIGGFITKRGLMLAGLILECVSILLMPMWGFGYVVVIIFGFIAYAKMKKPVTE